MRRINGFTIIEMLVVMLLITILVGIMLAVGSQVQQNSERSLTQTELRNLQAALQQYIHKTGQTPANMLSFLQGYQLMHAYAVGASWEQHANVITDLPANMVVAGTFTMTANSSTVTVPGVVEILDAYGHPIQYMSASGTTQTLYYYKAGQPLSPTPSSPPTPPGLAARAAWVYVSPGGTGIALPAQDSHAPYFYSFGKNGPQATGVTTSGYIYSYAP